MISVEFDTQEDSVKIEKYDVLWDTAVYSWVNCRIYMNTKYILFAIAVKDLFSVSLAACLKSFFFCVNVIDRRMVLAHLPLAWTHSSQLEDEKFMSVMEEIAKGFQPHWNWLWDYYGQTDYYGQIPTTHWGEFLWNTYRAIPATCTHILQVR